MKSLGILTGAVLAGIVLASPVLAQAVPPLTYVQPLPTDAVRAVQDRLRAAGAYDGAIDGVWGPDSVAALERFQARHQLQVSGQMNQATAATLGLDPAMLVSNPSAAASSTDRDLRPATVRAVQTRLRALGFYNGALDGIWGAGTQAAVERFQQGRGLQPNGRLNVATMDALGLGDGVAYRY